MATIEEETAARDKLNTALAELAEITPQSLVRREELGTTMSFAGGLAYFERTLKLFRDLFECELHGAPHSVLNQLADQTEVALSEFKGVQEFSPENQPENPVAARDTLINTIRDRYDNYYKVITPHISYAIRKGTDFEALEKTAREIVAEIHSIGAEVQEGKTALEQETGEILASMRRAVAEAGVSQHNIHFSEEAGRQEKAAIGWLKATVAFAVLALALAVYSIWYYSFTAVELSVSRTIQLVVAKVVAFSVLSFGIVWSAKNYRAHRHNFVVNRHRQNALSTFEAFVKAASDDDTKNAVLLRATEAIFSPVPSGYVEREREGQFTPQVIEVLRAAKRDIKE